MAGKPRPMSQIKQLLQFYEQGKGIKFIARSLGISKNTVKANLAKVSLSPLDFQARKAFAATTARIALRVKILPGVKSRQEQSHLPGTG